MPVDQVTLYRAPTTVCDADAIGEWLSGRINATVSVRNRFLETFGEPADLAEAFANARVLSPYDRDTGSTMAGILRYEERVIDDPARGGGVLYDGHPVQRTCNAVIPQRERSLSHLHVVLLDRVIGTWGDHDGRWHKRIAVLGQPALLSVPGLSEAPAKPEQYYQEQQRHALLSGDTPPREVLEGQLDIEIFLEDDPRTTEVMKSYVLKAYDFLETGEGFCADGDCRLSDPHRHGDLLSAHCGQPEYCSRHADMYEDS